MGASKPKYYQPGQIGPGNSVLEQGRQACQYMGRVTATHQGATYTAIKRLLRYPGREWAQL